MFVCRQGLDVLPSIQPELLFTDPEVSFYGERSEVITTKQPGVLGENISFGAQKNWVRP